MWGLMSHFNGRLYMMVIFVWSYSQPSTYLDRSLLEVRAINQLSVVLFPSVLLITLAWNVSLRYLDSNPGFLISYDNKTEWFDLNVNISNVNTKLLSMWVLLLCRCVVLFNEQDRIWMWHYSWHCRQHGIIYLDYTLLVTLKLGKYSSRYMCLSRIKLFIMTAFYCFLLKKRKPYLCCSGL